MTCERRTPSGQPARRRRYDDLTPMPTAQTDIAALDISRVRSQFPSLSQTVAGQPAVFLDGPGGTQVPQRVIDAISGYLKNSNANTCGAYATSQHTNAMIAEARAAMADFFGCDHDEVVFGPNMTNLAQRISSRTRVVAVGYASNAVGTINDVKEIVRLAHHKGALAYIDAVHYAPHGPIDVPGLDCDFLVCSSYKFFGPHMGVLYGKREHLKRLHPYKVRANTNESPYRWEWGTLNHEGIAGITGCVDYIADIGRRLKGAVPTRRSAILAAYEEIVNYERALCERLIHGLRDFSGLKIYGISDPQRFNRRCPTIALRVDGYTPLELATKLGERGLFTWDGNYYALNLTERL